MTTPTPRYPVLLLALLTVLNAAAATQPDLPEPDRPEVLNLVQTCEDLPHSWVFWEVPHNRTATPDTVRYAWANNAGAETYGIDRHTAPGKSLASVLSGRTGGERLVSLIADAVHTQRPVQVEHSYAGSRYDAVVLPLAPDLVAVVSRRLGRADETGLVVTDDVWIEAQADVLAAYSERVQQTAVGLQKAAEGLDDQTPADPPAPRSEAELSPQK